VFGKGVAVIGDQDNDRFVVQPQAAKRVQEHPDIMVDVGALPGVQPADVRDLLGGEVGRGRPPGRQNQALAAIAGIRVAVELGGRRPRLVWIERVHKEENRPCRAVGLQPGVRCPHQASGVVILRSAKLLHVLQGCFHDAPPLLGIGGLAVVVQPQPRERPGTVGVVFLAAHPLPGPVAAVQVHARLEVVVAVREERRQVPDTG